MDDLDEFIDDVETQSLVTIPEQFDEVVDIIAQEQREKGEQIVDAQERGKKPSDEVEQLDENGNPFWMKFIRADYLGESGNAKNQANSNKIKNNQKNKGNQG
jgi:hypothetical protein